VNQDKTGEADGMNLEVDCVSEILLSFFLFLPCGAGSN